jgi:hypothetical protein
MKNQKEQTTVEWLIERLLDLDYQFAKKLISLDVYSTTKVYLQEKAKEMEKERIENAWIAALDFGIEKMKGLNTLESKDAFEKFYKTTYGGNK